NTSFASLIVDNKGVGDLFTASKGGATKFTILNNGNISWAGTSNFQNVLATAATAARTYTFPDASGTICLTSNNCSASSIWATNGAGAIIEGNTTQDLLIGGTATNSGTTNYARAAFLNIAGTLTPTASLSAGVAGGSYLTADGKLATTALQTLTLGDS